MHGAPFQYFFLGVFVMLIVVVIRSQPSMQQLITAVNSIGNNPMAIVVLVIGCIMTVESHILGFDTNIASIIIGFVGGLLQAQTKDQLHPPGSVVDQKIEQKVITPQDPPPIPK